MTLFQQFITTMEHGKYAAFRDALLKAIEPRVTDQTFRNWEKGLYEPELTRRDVINQVALEITGKPIY